MGVGPRIACADRLDALDDRRLEVRFTADAVARVLATPSPASPRDIRPTYRATVAAAAHLAELLAPVPRALGQIAGSVRRLAIARGRTGDDVLVSQLEALHERTFDLWWAVFGLARAADSGKR
jgi:hypothetical protein